MQKGNNFAVKSGNFRWNKNKKSTNYYERKLVLTELL